MSLGLKLYYLRTRIREVTQTKMARDLGIRQATISNIEQGLSQPSLPLLQSLCTYFDVTPTYLLDPDGPLELTPADRWSNRHGLATTGQYLEARENQVQRLGGGSFLIALVAGTAVYDAEAARARASGTSDLAEALRIESAKRRRAARVLRDELNAERHASRLRRRGARGGS